MWPYWVMLLLPAAFAVNERFAVPPARRRGLTPVWLLAGATFTLLIGYRYQVGGDWSNYLRILSRFAHLSLEDVWRMGDPGYALLNWLGMQTSYGIYLVNLLCGLIFMIGLVVFCRSLPRPWLALAMAIPYLVIVVGMGYSRQGVAMIVLAALGRDRIFCFVFWVLLGALFHKTAVILLPIAAFAASQNRLLPRADHHLTNFIPSGRGDYALIDLIGSSPILSAKLTKALSY